MRYDKERGQIETSVRRLCALALSFGDIDSRSSAASLRERTAEGSRIHKKIVKELGEGYHSEVELKNTSKLDGIYYHVSGRADGIQYIDGEYTVDEIKTVSGRFFESGLDDRRHLSQLYCYAYFLCCA